MLPGMKKLTTALLAIAAVCALAVPAGAAAAKPVKYAGKTSSGHKVTFKLVNNKKAVDFVTGAPVTCIRSREAARPSLEPSRSSTRS
jgi:hypothetical protein